jgi:hypothetical protein
MYHLLANFECIEPLHQEVNAVIQEEGWTKVGIDKVHKIDSFLHKTQQDDDKDEEEDFRLYWSHYENFPLNEFLLNWL